MRKCTNIFTIYEEVVSHICMTLHPISLNFLIYEENFLFFFISVRRDMPVAEFIDPLLKLKSA
jgi:hypothetical protein